MAKLDSEGLHISKFVLKRPKEVFIPLNDDQDANVSYSNDLAHYFALRLTDAQVSKVLVNIKVPDDFDSFISLKAIWVSGGTGSMYWRIQAHYAAHNELGSTHSDEPAYGTTANTGALNINIQSPANPLTLSSLAKGDILGLEFRRDATNDSDTLGASVYLLGLLFSYNSKAKEGTA